MRNSISPPLLQTSSLLNTVVTLLRSPSKQLSDEVPTEFFQNQHFKNSMDKVDEVDWNLANETLVERCHPTRLRCASASCCWDATRRGEQEEDLGDGEAETVRRLADCGMESENSADETPRFFRPNASNIHSHVVLTPHTTTIPVDSLSHPHPHSLPKTLSQPLSNELVLLPHPNALRLFLATRAPLPCTDTNTRTSTTSSCPDLEPGRRNTPPACAEEAASEGRGGCRRGGGRRLGHAFRQHRANPSVSSASTKHIAQSNTRKENTTRTDIHVTHARRKPKPGRERHTQAIDRKRRHFLHNRRILESYNPNFELWQSLNDNVDKGARAAEENRRHIETEVLDELAVDAVDTSVTYEQQLRESSLRDVVRKMKPFLKQSSILIPTLPKSDALVNHQSGEDTPAEECNHNEADHSDRSRSSCRRWKTGRETDQRLTRKAEAELANAEIAQRGSQVSGTCE
ncbi:hypothetical protein BLNAU_20848 [Blattamonas nauphoetae]|uniref:Uncharacterized protein n=1 Tax=Blattamonas nauphoetae TaxID=2049346 RepID=A0ABQ9WP91_9EUKA|nr:hypothetical protein BLNAU_23787 [Blattamonas nauphoetae]KAK2944238.1 hypothetical protein BLNAU_20848 [Blattamonas nauphoetae]